ncbi:MAG: hypothetical protein KJ066_07485 [Acidobacteria bacterium]|nr:hypothetical protein [Acidobacteriota bacterium]
MISERLVQWIALFNEDSLDVPDAFLDRRCVFRLNGTAYEDTLGRSTADPLVRLLGRGPSAYRLLAKRLRFALPDARVTLVDLAPPDALPGLMTGTWTLTGTGRDSGEPLEAEVGFVLVVDAAGAVTECAVEIAQPHLDAIASAANG